MNNGQPRHPMGLAPTPSSIMSKIIMSSEVKEADEFTQRYRIVLRQLSKGSRRECEYVHHMETLGSMNEPEHHTGYHNGGYSMYPEEAIKGFLKRCAEEGLKVSDNFNTEAQ